MKNHSAASGSDVLLGVIAIRLAALVLTGSILLLLPRQPRDDDSACALPLAERSDLQIASKAERVRVSDPVAGDMLLHD
ncbi:MULTISPECIES: hypothetical protein [unclassified Bradyrhizobium]|uniref:hypothetical protein n=1 Tax=unclassified Bradyrhizobium TaxID=2631580 RepID=UPI00102E34BF|nr:MULTISPECIES: hypothetical protein [unclassified Bradyrhizobium]MDI4233289.1 hypothetical protein [Bradyrhizobium sp. Arg237L]